MSALDAWTSALGQKHVLTDAVALDRVSSATFATNARVIAVVRPASREDVQSCMRIANRWKTPIYPVSGGRNWGLGSRVPPHDAVVMDLSRMNVVRGFSERDGTATVEAGVTFRQLHTFLDERRSRFLLPVIGGPADASVIGNIVERGDAAGPYGHRGDHDAGGAGRSGCCRGEDPCRAGRERCLVGRSPASRVGASSSPMSMSST